jgi:hypothetical protein
LFEKISRNFQKRIDICITLWYNVYTKAKRRSPKLNNRTRQTVFRQTPEEFEQLQKDARKHKMNVSKYLRWLIETERENRKRRKNNVFS